MPAIILRRIDFGDYDLIVTIFTLNKGKISVIAKSAKKSKKRFAGILELFSVLDVVCTVGRGKGLPVLQEATLTHAFPNIRSKIIKTAYASYWAELINQWMEEGQKQVQLFNLFRYVLQELDIDRTSEAALSILFQIKFMTIAGLDPDLKQCIICRAELEKMKKIRIKFDLSRGGIICDGCASGVLHNNGKSGVSRDICALSFRERTPELEIFTSDKGMTENPDDRGQRSEVRGQKLEDRS